MKLKQELAVLLILLLLLFIPLDKLILFSEVVFKAEFLALLKKLGNVLGLAFSSFEIVFYCYLKGVAIYLVTTEFFS